MTAMFERQNNTQEVTKADTCYRLLNNKLTNKSTTKHAQQVNKTTSICHNRTTKLV